MSMAKKLNILHVLSQRPDSTGSGIYVQAMIREAAARGYDNALVAGLGPGCCNDTGCIEDDKALFVRFNSADVSFPIPGMSDVMPYDSTRFCDLSEEALCAYEEAFARLLRTAVDRFKPDIIHSHHLWIVSALTRRLFPDIPIVTSCHGSDLRQFQQCPHLQEKVREGCRGINVVLALSEAQKHDIIRLYRMAQEQIVITGAGYNETLFYADRKPSPHPVEIVYAGKLSKAKGVPWLLRVLRSITFPPWRLHLVGSGSGDEEAWCLSLARELGEKVIRYGALPQSYLAGIMRESHVLVLPSFFEGLPLVLLEGLASGCRIVATDLPGTKEVIGGADVEYITLVKTPRLRCVDEPYREDEPVFEGTLQQALQHQIKAAYYGVPIDLSSLRSTLDAYTWSGVFLKVREAYLSFFP
jgi:glycosyltransferase involved in cell wall biosynthesis